MVKGLSNCIVASVFLLGTMPDRVLHKYKKPRLSINLIDHLSKCTLRTDAWMRRKGLGAKKGAHSEPGFAVLLEYSSNGRRHLAGIGPDLH